MSCVLVQAQQCKLTDMLRSLAVSTSGTKVSPDCPFKHLYHKSEEGSCQGSIPSTLRMFVANESVLSLDFKKLEGIRQACKDRETVFYRCGNIRVLQGSADEISSTTWYMSILA